VGRTEAEKVFDGREEITRVKRRPKCLSLQVLAEETETGDV